MEERSRDRRAVGKFIDEACRRLGGREELSEWLQPWHKVGYGGVGHWIRGVADPPAWVLFLISHQLDLSLDDFVSESQGYSHGARLNHLEEQMLRVLTSLGLTERKQATE